jgi:hypothetical protein
VVELDRVWIHLQERAGSRLSCLQGWLSQASQDTIREVALRLRSTRQPRQTHSKVNAVVQPIRGTAVKEKGKRSFFIKNFNVSSSSSCKNLTQHEYDLHSPQSHAVSVTGTLLTPTNNTLWRASTRTRPLSHHNTCGSET